MAREWHNLFWAACALGGVGMSTWFVQGVPASRGRWPTIQAAMVGGGMGFLLGPVLTPMVAVCAPLAVVGIAVGSLLRPKEPQHYTSQRTCPCCPCNASGTHPHAS
jgi:hypothetical protein